MGFWKYLRSFLDGILFTFNQLTLWDTNCDFGTKHLLCGTKRNIPKLTLKEHTG